MSRDRDKIAEKIRKIAWSKGADGVTDWLLSCLPEKKEVDPGFFPENCRAEGHNACRDQIKKNLKGE